jgi:DNA-binding response OmpR family regulator
MKALKILVIDDDEALAAVIQHILDGEGYDNRAARNEVSADRIFRMFRPGLVISDLRLPGGSGVDLIRRLRKIDHADFRTIYISGDLDRFRAELNEERDQYRVMLLPKPFRRIELLRLVAEFERALAVRAA